MKTSRIVLIISIFILSLTLVGVALAAASRSAPAQTAQTIQVPGLTPEGEGPWVVRAYYDDPVIIAQVASRIEPWEVNRNQKYIVLEVNKEEFLWLEWLGFRVEVNAELTKMIQQPPVPLPGQVNGIPGYPCYRTVEETFATAQAIVAAHPDLASWIDIGDSWEKTMAGGLPGYDMMVLRLTNSNIPGPKPKLFAMSAIHAREYTTAELATRFAEYLVNNYNVDPDVTWLLDYNEIHLLLQSNPDGRKKAETGVLWRKNTDNDDGCTIPSDWGTDLNRNFEFQWGCCGGSSGSPCAETYRGPSAASEPEVQAVQDYISVEFPDQRPPELSAPAPITATGVFLDIHSYSQLVLWPWGFTSTPTGNGTAFQTLGRKFAYFNGYEPDQSIYLYPTDGTTDDFAYGELGLAAYTFELGTSFFQDCSSFENTIYPDNLPALIYAAKVARTPYLTPAGPDSLSVVASPAGVPVGEPVQLSATADDTRYFDTVGSEPTQNIAAAEYYIDVPPWSTNPVPVAYPMTPADGAFDEKTESVVATLDTSSLSQGRHIIFVRSQDINGNWGAVSAAFVYVLDPEVSPVIEGYVRDVGDNSPLLATVSAGVFATVSDPATGHYAMMVISGTYDMSAIAEGHNPATVDNVQAFDYQTVHQDFNLEPTCAIFSDDVESGNQGWTAQPPWGITTSKSHSPTHSWTDSPAGQYSNNQNTSLTSQAFDLSSATGVSLNFWHTYATESGWDFGYVEYSINGSVWTMVASYTGSQPDWEEVNIPLPALAGQSNVRIRFRFYSDQSVTNDGWYLDDIQLLSSGSGCITPIPPTADFITNAPVLPGEPVDFINMTHGTQPLSYFWDFGDGQGTSSESDPTYTYAIADTYLVTLTATNSLGSDSVTHLVVVQPCTPIDAITLTLQTTGTLFLGQPIDLIADIAPDDATKPYQYTLDYGDGNQTSGFSALDPLPLTHTYTLPGDFSILFSAMNCPAADAVTDTLSVSIFAEEGIALSPVSAQATGLPGEVITYTLRVTNTLPLTNSINLNLSDETWVSQVSTTTVGPLGPGEGQGFNVTVAVPETASGGDSDTLLVTASSVFPGVIPVNASLTTSAGNVYGLALAPLTSEKTGLPGTTVTYTLVLTNTGNTTDTFSILASSQYSITFAVQPETAYQGGSVTLGRDQQAVISAMVTIPASAQNSDSNTATVTFTSNSDSLVAEEARLTTRVIQYQVMLPLVPAQGE